jgi:predicted permease
MSGVIGELLPVFILIVIGYVVRSTRLVSADAFGQVNRFGFFILYPAFLFQLSSQADLSGGEAGVFILGVVLGFAVMIALALATRPLFAPDEGPAFTSVFQGAVRWNGFILLAAAPALYGAEGPHLIGVAFGPLVLMVNFVCVLVLARWGDNGANNMRAVIDQIIANPLILGCAAGLLAQAFHLRDLGPVSDVLDLLGNAAMPIALLCVGAGLDFKAVRAARVRVFAATAAKLLLAPAVMWSMVILVGGSPLTAAIAAGVGATPTAAAGYTMAREMGGDARLMAAIVTASTLVSFITMPLVIGLTLR